MASKNPILQRIMEALNVTTVLEIADFVGIKPASVNSWGNNVPYKHLVKISEKSGKSINWILHGDPIAAESDEDYGRESKTTDITCRKIDFSTLYQAIEILESNSVNRDELESFIKALHRKVANYPENTYPHAPEGNRNKGH